MIYPVTVSSKFRNNVFPERGYEAILVRPCLKTGGRVGIVGACLDLELAGGLALYIRNKYGRAYSSWCETCCSVLVTTVVVVVFHSFSASSSVVFIIIEDDDDDKEPFVVMIGVVSLISLCLRSILHRSCFCFCCCFCFVDHRLVFNRANRTVASGMVTT